MQSFLSLNPAGSIREKSKSGGSRTEYFNLCTDSSLNFNLVGFLLGGIPSAFRA